MKQVLNVLILAVLFSFISCISWDEGWKTKVEKSGKGDVKTLLNSAASLELSANSADKIKNLITEYEKIAAIEPDNYTALSKLGEFTHLYAYIYASEKDDKEKYYLKSIKYCEQAMYTNPEFKKLADQGKPAWECTKVLTVNEMEAMFYWYVAIGQYWTECFNPFSRLINFYWPSRAKKVLERMSEIQPDWKYGRVHMAWGAFYAIVPGFMGGDINKSAEEFKKAIQVGPDGLVNYYVRARYLHTKNGDQDAFKKDLEYILSKDIKKVDYEYPWAFGYQQKAKELLAKTNELF